MLKGQEYATVIKTLKDLKDSEKKLSRKVNKFLMLVPYLLMPVVGRFIKANPDTIQDVLCNL